MVRIHVAALLAAVMMVVPSAVRAGDATSAEIDALKKEVEALRKSLAGGSQKVSTSSVEKALGGKYGPNATVTTKSGNLKIGGLLQVWYYSIANDSRGQFQHAARPNTDILDTNQCSDNDSFRIRRSEIKFTMDIHENVTAVVMIDPAREATSFPNLYGGFKRKANISPEVNSDSVDGAYGSTTVVSAVQTGAGAAPRLLQDAYINYHGVVPHHDFQIGQFKPKLGMESAASASELDFVERSMLGQANEARDLGVTIHGSWIDERVQYWLGAFDGAGDYYGTQGQLQNRSDNNDEKDFLVAALFRPVWKQEKWGSLEIGGAYQFGTHGETGTEDPANIGVLNGLNRHQDTAQRLAAWGYYAPGSVAKGWWIKGEYTWIRDRVAPGALDDLVNGAFVTGSKPFSVDGWYVSTGYHIGKSVFADSAPAWLKPWEFTFRYDTMRNVLTADPDYNAHTDRLYTTVYTAGVNYYIKGHNAKIQANYNWVLENVDGYDTRRWGMRDVDNDSFVVNFQVAF